MIGLGLLPLKHEDSGRAYAGPVEGQRQGFEAGRGRVLLGIHGLAFGLVGYLRSVIARPDGRRRRTLGSDRMRATAFELAISQAVTILPR